MTPTQYADKAAKKIENILNENKPFERAVKNIVAKQAQRIFIDGLNSSGGIIGHYSTKAMYINPNTGATPRKTNKGKSKFKLEGLEPTVGKYGEHIFTAATAWHGVKGTKAGDPHRTTYLAGGYKELRNRIGRRIDRMNLTFTNSLLSDFCNATILPNTEPKKILALPHKITVNEYQTGFSRKDSVDKKNGLEKRFGSIFKLTAQEKEDFFKTLDFNFKKALADD